MTPNPDPPRPAVGLDLLEIARLERALEHLEQVVQFEGPSTIAAVDETEGGVQVTYDLVMEVKDAPKPACVAQVVYRYYR